MAGRWTTWPPWRPKINGNRAGSGIFKGIIDQTLLNLTDSFSISGHLPYEWQKKYSPVPEYGNRKPAFAMKQGLSLYEHKDSNRRIIKLNHENYNFAARNRFSS